MDRRVHDDFLDHPEKEIETRKLSFLLDEGLELLAAYAKINDAGVRRALAGLVTALGNAGARKVTEAP